MPRFVSYRLASRASLAALLVTVTSALACSGGPDTGSFGQANPGSSSPSSPSDGSGASPTNGAEDAGPGSPTPGTPGADAGGSPAPGAPPTGGGGSGHDAGAGADADTDAGAVPAATTDYAPYFPTWVWGGSGYAFNSLVDLEAKAGLKEVTIAFVLSNGGCNTTQDIEQNLSDVKAFVAAGGHVKASFGGADGTYVEARCTTASALAGAIESFVDATGITDLDFDIEQNAVLTDSVNAMRGQALKLAQDAKGIQVAFTLAADAHTSSSGGLTSQGLSVVSHALDAGVTVRHVNLMTMDYGDSYAGQPLAPVAIGSLNDAHSQLLSIAPTLSKAQAWAMLGVIPMIGKNDDAEVFSLADAKTLVDFAKANALGRVSFWSIDRDQVCSGGADYNSCSTVQTSNFAFNAVLKTAAE
jgi:chitinase